jgi:hypothetical protein
MKRIKQKRAEREARRDNKRPKRRQKFTTA